RPARHVAAKSADCRGCITSDRCLHDTPPQRPVRPRSPGRALPKRCTRAITRRGRARPSRCPELRCTAPPCARRLEHRRGPRPEGPQPTTGAMRAIAVVAVDLELTHFHGVSISCGACRRTVPPLELCG